MKQIFNQPDMDNLAQKIAKVLKNITGRMAGRPSSSGGTEVLHYTTFGGYGGALFYPEELNLDEFEKGTLFPLFQDLGYVQPAINGLFETTKSFNQKLKDAGLEV